MQLGIAVFLGALFSCAPIATPAAQLGADDNAKVGLAFPLDHPNTIEFTVKEGTWLSLDLSPDGKTIVFELLGELYTLPVTGGEATLFMGGPSYNGMPRYSPDGKRIVFVSDRSGSPNLWLCDADGSNLKAVTAERGVSFTAPIWTPDGAHIIAARGLVEFDNVPTQIRSYDLRGGDGQLVVQSGLDDLAGMTLSSDGNILYYTKGDIESQVWRWDRRTGEIRQVTDAAGFAFRPGLTPDGKTLLYFTTFRNQGGLRARDLETGRERWIAFPVDKRPSAMLPIRDTMPGYAFTADGKEILLAMDGKIQRLSLATGSAQEIPFTAKVAKQVHPPIHYQYRVDESPRVQARCIRHPRLSPDGTRFAFSAFNRLYVKDLNGGEPKRLTQDQWSEFSPSWSSDGKSIVYATYSIHGGAIRRVAVEGGDSQLIAQGEQLDDPIFAPDGRGIVYLDRRHVTEEHGHGEAPGENSMPAVYTTPVKIMRVSLSGGNPQAILSNTRAVGVQFLRDSDRLYFYEGFGGGDLSSVRLDGSDLKPVMKASGHATPWGSTFRADAIALSPDRTTAFLKMYQDENLYVVSLPWSAAPFDLSVLGLTVPHRIATEDSGEDIDFAADGSVTWASGNKFYRIKSSDLLTSDAKPQVVEIKIELPRAKPHGTLLLRGARIITMRGDEVVDRGEILVQDNRIVQIGRAGTIHAPSGSKILDVTGKTISPGLIDVHNHWNNYQYGPFSLPQGWAYLADLAYGLTSLRDPQSQDTNIFDSEDQIDIGAAIGPRILTTGPGVFHIGDYQSKEQVARLIRKYKEVYKVNYIKEYVSGDRLIRQWVAMACQQFGMTPTSEGKYQAFMALTEMIDGYGGHEHGLPSPFYDDMAQLLAHTQVFYTPTITIYDNENYYFETTDVAHDPRMNRFMPTDVLDFSSRRRPGWTLPEDYAAKTIAQSAAKAVHAGAHVCLGAHGEFHGLGTHWELWNLALGLTPMEALRAATLSGAQALGLEEDIGSIEPGKLADLVVYDKNPLDDIHNSTSIRYVLKNGELFDSNTMDALWPVEKKLPRQFWQGTQPSAAMPAQP
jgi:Tol biopolymer transport system component